MKHHFCTYFDQNYLSRALALHGSLRACGAQFTLWTLCLDTVAFETVRKLGLPDVEPIALEAFEQGDSALLAAKHDRSRAEYYFTCTPSLPLYILDRRPDVEIITYLDADLFFFSDPHPLFDELADGSVGIIAHRFSGANRRSRRFGIYNVGWVSFRRDRDGLDCLRWWRGRCLEWCCDRVEEHRFADQKYLDTWPERFAGVRVLQHKGANLAPWNIANYRVNESGGRVTVDDDPLVFFHFHGFQQITSWLYNSNFGRYHTRPSGRVRRAVIGPYVRALQEASGTAAVPHGIRRRESRHESLVWSAKPLARLMLGLINREYVLVVNGRVL